MSDDKRRSERLPMFRVCCYNIEGRDYADLSTNISERGIFIKNFSPPPLGTRVTLTVTLPEEWGNLPLQIVGKVARVDDGEDPHKRGMGIEFTSVKADSRPIIEYFIREVYDKTGLNEPQLKTSESTEGGDGPSFEYDLDIDVEEPQ